MVNDVIAETEAKMKKALEALQHEFTNIRTGRASTALIENIQIEAYGSTQPLNQLATLSAPEPRALVIQPWDRGMFGPIEKAIQKSELNLTTNNDGKVIRVPIPPLTEQRRKELVKVVKSKSEESKVAIRNVRRDHMNNLKKLLNDKSITEDEDKRAQDRIQGLTDKYIKEADSMAQRKEQEILEV